MSIALHRRIHRSAVRQSDRKAETEIALLSAEEKSVRDRITELERFIVKAPERAQQAQIAHHDRLNTLPPPDEFLPDDAEDPEAAESDLARRARLTRAQEAILRRRRAINLTVFVLVALALAAFGLWFADQY